jgi:hypothetical protein
VELLILVFKRQRKYMPYVNQENQTFVRRLKPARRTDKYQQKKVKWPTGNFTSSWRAYTSSNKYKICRSVVLCRYIRVQVRTENSNSKQHRFTEIWITSLIKKGSNEKRRKTISFKKRSNNWLLGIDSFFKCSYTRNFLKIWNSLRYSDNVICP